MPRASFSISQTANYRILHICRTSSGRSVSSKFPHQTIHDRFSRVGLYYATMKRQARQYVSVYNVILVITTLLIQRLYDNLYRGARRAQSIACRKTLDGLSMYVHLLPFGLRHVFNLLDPSQKLHPYVREVLCYTISHFASFAHKISTCLAESQYPSHPSTHISTRTTTAFGTEMLPHTTPGVDQFPLWPLVLMIGGHCMQSAPGR